MVDFNVHHSYVKRIMYCIQMLHACLQVQTDHHVFCHNDNNFFFPHVYFRLHNIPGVFQRSQGNGPLNRLLVAAKRKYMDTELPPQESEGKVTFSQFWKPTVAFIWASD